MVAVGANRSFVAVFVICMFAAVATPTDFSLRDLLGIPHSWLWWGHAMGRYEGQVPAFETFVLVGMSCCAFLCTRAALHKGAVMKDDMSWSRVFYGVVATVLTFATVVSPYYWIGPPEPMNSGKYEVLYAGMFSGTFFGAALGSAWMATTTYLLILVVIVLRSAALWIWKQIAPMT